MNHIVKRAGHTEDFESRKVYASVYAACLALKVTEPEAEIIAKNVTQGLEKWLKDRGRVTSHEITREVGRILTFYHPDAAYLYLHHRDIC
jgi:transcriptional regulator NrdR family protein